MMARTQTFLIETPTPEGLEVAEFRADDGTTIVQEVGHFGYVIYEYRLRPDDPEVPGESYSRQEPGATFLVARLADLERRCEEMATTHPLHVDLQRWKRNRKAARRRLRRWITENGAEHLEVPHEFHDLVNRVIHESPEPYNEFDVDQLQKKLWEEGAIHDFYEYERRRAERVILVVTELPQELRAMLSQANEAYFHGLFRAAVALCRALLEDLLRRIVQARPLGVGPVPINDEHLDVLINCIPSDLLSPRAKTLAHEVRTRGNAALHDAGVQFSEEETWRLLAATRRLVELLINRGALAAQEHGTDA